MAVDTLTIHCSGNYYPNSEEKGEVVDKIKEQWGSLDEFKKNLQIKLQHDLVQDGLG